MTYRAPINDMLLSLNHGAGLLAAVEAGHYNGYDPEFSASVIEEAGKFATDVLEPLNQTGDRAGIKLTDKGVITAPGWPDAYKRWCEGGWNAVSGSEDFGGQGLPLAVHSAVNEIWSASNLAFGLCPLLTLSAIDALDAHGSDELKKIYLEKLITGEWPGTMQLTEPQAGTDVGALRTRAKQADGTYRLFGSKIFITAATTTRATTSFISFSPACPARPPDRRASHCSSRRNFWSTPTARSASAMTFTPAASSTSSGSASPTCTMTMGDKGGTIAYLVGKENGGMAAMFTMMNQARLGVGLQGVGIADRAYQRALAYAQGASRARRSAARTPADPIIMYRDVKRNLMIMRGMTAAARSVTRRLWRSTCRTAHRSKVREGCGARRC
jgi:alkylation response protein AidB-like acyl-CoA dehydrogenase